MSPLHSRSQARRQSGKTTDSHPFDRRFAAQKVENRRFPARRRKALVVSLPRTA
jgi:hypothetical protein